VPEAGDQADEGAHLRDHLRDVDNSRFGPTTTEGFLPVDQDKRGQQRDRHREGDDADLGGQVERCRREERLHHDHADRDQRAIAQIVLPEPFLF